MSKIKFYKTYIIIILIIFGYLLLKMLDKLKSSFYYQPDINQYIRIPKEVEDIYITNKNNTKLNGWYYSSQYNGKPSKIILYCHGNGGNITVNNNIISEMISNRISFLIFDYRGYGKSEGTSITNSIYEDAKDWLDYLVDKKQINQNDIIPLGHSIGSFPAAKLADIYKLPKVIILSGFHSVSEIVMEILSSPFNYIASIMTQGDLNTGKHLKQYQGKSLILHSQTDDIISYEHAEKNSNYGGILNEIQGDHNNPIIDWNFIKDFMGL